MGDRLRELWDFDDLDGTERRFLEQLENESSGAGRAEVMTQLARLRAHRGQFTEGEKLIAQARAIGGSDPAVRIRADLELGRLWRTKGDTSGAQPLFESAFTLAVAVENEFLAADAAHMAALVAPDMAGTRAWTRRGLDIAESSADRSVSNWSGSLLNNLGCRCADTGDHEGALEAFERALEARLRHPEWPGNIRHARESVTEELRVLGREDEARRLEASERTS